MIRRCEDPKEKAYPNYGGRGIRVCDLWRNSFVSFLRDMGVRPEGKSIDRRENNGNYEKNNCRWATSTEQGNNRRVNILLTVNGETHTASEWARIRGFHRNLISYRLRRGWSPEKAVNTPRCSLKNPGKPLEFKGKNHNLSEWARILKIPWDCLYRRINYYHWDLEKAFNTPVDISRHHKTKAHDAK
jgi:hypothetical protein